MPWKQHLSDAELKKVREAAIDAGLATPENLKALLSHLPPAYVAQFPIVPMPIAQLLVHLSEMNTLFSLTNGDVPLVKWLKNAADLTYGKPESLVFEKALDMITLSPTEPPPAANAPAGAAGTAPPVIASANTDVTPEAKIFEVDGTLSVHFLSQALETTRAVCKMLVNRYFDGHVELEPKTGQPRVTSGTGWLIAPGLVITNHHVINARHPAYEPDATPADFKLQGDGSKILFGYYDDPEPAAKLSATLLTADKGLDFAILRLEAGAPARKHLTLLPHVLRKTLQQALGTVSGVNILQHPGGKPMRLGFRNNYVIQGDETALTYVTDTDLGSSGSPVCDDYWKVAALHRGSRSISGAGIMVNGTLVRQENYGIPVSAILAKLKADHPDLYQEITVAQAQAI